MLKDVARARSRGRSSATACTGLQRHRRCARSRACGRDRDRDVDGDGTVARLLGRTREQRTPLQGEVDRIGRMLGVAVIAIAVVVVTAILLDRRHRNCLRHRFGAARRGRARCRRGPGGAARRPLGGARLGRAADGAAASDREAAFVGGDARLRVGDLLGQDRDADEERDDGAEGRDRLGRGRRHRQRLPPEGELRVGGRPLADPVLLAEVSAVLAAAAWPNDAVLREEDGRLDDSGRPDGSGLPRGGGEGRRAGRVAPRALSARRRDPLQLRAEADEHRACRARGRASDRGLHQGRARRLAGAVRGGTGRRPDAVRTPLSF